jgi:large subunit ribosomal protein L9
MKIILLEEVQGLGSRGQSVEVKPGYARNYLMPRRLALPATESNLKVYATHMKQGKARENKSRTEAERIAQKLRGVSVTARAQAGEDDRLHGAITSKDIAELLAAQDIVVDRHQIVLEEPLKMLGVFEVSVKLFQDIGATVKVWVVRE